MLFASGCIVADPPRYEAPEKTRPILDLFRADPPLRQVLVRRTDDVIRFNIPVRSEDAGDPLVAALHLDWGTARSDHLTNREIPSSTFDDEDRAITFQWTVEPNLKDCHLLTLLVFHKANIDLQGQQSLVIEDQAIATWWANFNPDETDPDTLKDCPQ